MRIEDDDEIFDGVIGGSAVDEAHIRTDLVEPRDLIVTSKTDRHIVRLLTLPSTTQSELRQPKSRRLGRTHKAGIA